MKRNAVASLNTTAGGGTRVAFSIARENHSRIESRVRDEFSQRKSNYAVIFCGIITTDFSLLPVGSVFFDYHICCFVFIVFFFRYGHKR